MPEMDMLADFARKDMIEQIMLLEEIKASRPPEAVPALLDLYADPLADPVVDEMLYHTLFELLDGEDDQTAAALVHPSSRVQLLAVRRAGENGAGATLPALLSLLERSCSAEVLAEALRALVNFREPEVVDKLLAFLGHEDYAVTAWAMRALTASADGRAAAALRQLISTDQGLAQGEFDLRLAMAVENLASFRDEETIGFLIGYIHHPSPACRKEVISALASMKGDILPALEKCLEQGCRDEKIMAANVIGMTGERKGADILVAHLHGGQGLDPNLKFAIYEALGRIPSLRSAVGLADGLREEDELVLLAVVTALEHQSNPGLVKSLVQALDQGGNQRERLLKAMITARATQLFAALHGTPHGAALLDLLLAGGDREAMAIFREQLAEMAGEQAAADLQRFSPDQESAAGGRILAADDSKAMLFFYKGVAADMGVELITAGDGKEALEYLRDHPVDMLITDMNMPNMDGVELAREVRKLPRGAGLPILMATTESERSQVDLAVAAGVDGFVSKPFTREELRSRIETVLACRRN